MRDGGHIPGAKAPVFSGALRGPRLKLGVPRSKSNDNCNRWLDKGRSIPTHRKGAMDGHPDVYCGRNRFLPFDKLRVRNGNAKGQQKGMEMRDEQSEGRGKRWRLSGKS